MSITRPNRIGLCLMLCTLLCACSGTTSLSEGFSLSEQPLIGKIVWHDLMTEDPAAAQAFYAEILGWSFVTTERPNGGPYILARSGQRFVAGILEVADPPDGAEYSRWLGYLSVRDVDEAVALTISEGGTSVLAPREIGQVGRGAVISDPQGALIGLLRSRRGDPDDSMLNMPGTIGWHELLAEDARQATRFYERLTGMQGRNEERRNGTYYILNDGGRDRAGILSNPLDDTEPAWLAHFIVTDLEQAVSRVPALGGRVLLAPSEELRDGTMALVLDPGGAILILSKIP